MTKLMRLELKSEICGDGSTVKGFVNITMPAVKLIIAQQVQADVAERLVALWNLNRTEDLSDGP